MGAVGEATAALGAGHEALAVAEVALVALLLLAGGRRELEVGGVVADRVALTGVDDLGLAGRRRSSVNTRTSARLVLAVLDGAHREAVVAVGRQRGSREGLVQVAKLASVSGWSARVTEHCCRRAGLGVAHEREAGRRAGREARVERDLAPALDGPSMIRA